MCLIEKTDLFQYARLHYDALKTIDSSNKYKSLMKECLLRKYNFWNEHGNIYPDTKEKAESKKIIQRVLLLLFVRKLMGIMIANLSS